VRGPAERWPRAWPHLRAAALCLVVFGNLMYAVPFPRKMVEEDKREVWRKGDLDMWYGWVGGVIPHDRAAFGEAVIDGNNALYHVGSAFHAPVRPIFRTLRTTQQWGLFGIVAEAPEALVIEVERDGKWVEVERRLHPEHRWNDAVFRYRRVRGTWDSVKDDKPAPLYDSFCRWAAGMAFADHPGIERVRIYRHRHFVLAPWEHEALEPLVLNEQIFTRDQTELWVRQ